MPKLTLDELAIVREQAKDPNINKHNLKWATIRGRIQQKGWSVEKAFNTPVFTHSQAGQLAAKNPNWRNFTYHVVTDRELKNT